MQEEYMTSEDVLQNFPQKLLLSAGTSSMLLNLKLYKLLLNKTTTTTTHEITAQ